MKVGTFRQKVVSTLVDLLKQGLSPAKLALVVTLGIMIGIFPVLGIATVACTAVAVLFGLNLVAIQMANYLAFPLQIILFFPFLKIGEAVSGNTLPAISESTLTSAFNEDYFLALRELSQYLVLSSLGWALSLLPIFLITFFVSWVLIKRLQPVFSSS